MDLAAHRWYHPSFFSRYSIEIKNSVGKARELARSRTQHPYQATKTYNFNNEFYLITRRKKKESVFCVRLVWADLKNIKKNEEKKLRSPMKIWELRNEIGVQCNANCCKCNRLGLLNWTSAQRSTGLYGMRPPATQKTMPACLCATTRLLPGPHFIQFHLNY